MCNGWQHSLVDKFSLMRENCAENKIKYKMNYDSMNLRETKLTIKVI